MLLVACCFERKSSKYIKYFRVRTQENSKSLGFDDFYLKIIIFVTLLTEKSWLSEQER